MLTISSHYFDVLESITNQDDTIDTKAEFGNILQLALELEFSTIPPYLSAAYSLDATTNSSIRNLIVRIAKEEMLHMTAVGNVMNAIGIPPQLTNTQFIPEYPYLPTMLDMAGFEMNIQSFSRDKAVNESLVRDFFMRIEAPENPGVFPVAMDALEAVAPRPKTIGLFYEMIINIIENDKIPGLFDIAEANAWKQLVAKPTFVSPGLVFPNFKPLNVDGTFKDYPLLAGYDLKVTDKTSAVKFLKGIVDEGEASSQHPIAAEGLAAHYYRFESIVKKKNLIVDSSFPEQFAFSGQPLILDPSGVWEFDKINPKEEDYTGVLRDKIHEFNLAYSSILQSLHAAFNAAKESDIEPAYIDSRDAMMALPKIAKDIKSIAIQEGKKGGLPFQYIAP